MLINNLLIILKQQHHTNEPLTDGGWLLNAVTFFPSLQTLRQVKRCYHDACGPHLAFTCTMEMRWGLLVSNDGWSRLFRFQQASQCSSVPVAKAVQFFVDLHIGLVQVPGCFQRRQGRVDELRSWLLNL